MQGMGGWPPNPPPPPAGSNSQGSSYAGSGYQGDYAAYHGQYDNNIQVASQYGASQYGYSDHQCGPRSHAPSDYAATGHGGSDYMHPSSHYSGYQQSGAFSHATHATRSPAAAMDIHSSKSQPSTAAPTPAAGAVAAGSLTLGGIPYVHPSLTRQGAEPTSIVPYFAAMGQPVGYGPPAASGRVSVNPYDIKAITVQQGVQQMQDALRGLQLSNPATAPWSVETYKQTGVRRALRPGFGAAGRPVTVAANHFPIHVTATKAYQYDVNIKALPSEGDKPTKAHGPARAPPPFPQSLGRRILAEIGLKNGWPKGWAYDGRKNLFCPTPFLGQEDKQEYAMTLAPMAAGARERSFVVSIRFLCIVDLSSLQDFIAGKAGPDPTHVALQVLDLVLRNAVTSRDTAAVIGSSAYFYLARDPDMWRQLGKGLEAWGGYKQSVRACQFGLSLNVDLAATAFVMGDKPLHELVADVLGVGSVDELAAVITSKKEMRSLREGLKGVKVVIERGPGKVYKKAIKQVAPGDCLSTTFRYEAEDRDVNVVYYNQVVFDYDIQYPFLPPVNLSSHPKRPMWTPMELCRTVPGERRRLMEDASLTTSMLRFAGMKPQSRQRYLERVVASSDLAGFAGDPCVAAFGVEVAPKMIEVKARVLEPPCLAYSSPTCINPGTKGFWNLVNTRFPAAATLDSWAMCVLLPRKEAEIEGEQGIQAFLDDMVRMLNSAGIQCEPPPRVFGDGCNVGAAMQQAKEVAEAAFGKPCQLICVLLPHADKDMYRDVKQASDSRLGLPSQCFVAGKAGVGARHKLKGRMQYCANVVLKINAKLGGINVRLAGDAHVKLMSSLPLGARPFIVFGADVTHPTGYTEQDPSIAAVTATYDKSLGRYSTLVLAQKHRQEIISDLRLAAKALLVNFYRKNGQKKPESIIFYRDGVSEGQFAEVLSAEYAAIRAACFELEANYCPPITFVVVQKRHGTRLFPHPTTMDRSGNTLPGTVIDSHICHPTQFDFYLNSHSGLQGHNKAAHYHVLVDENGFSADSLQSFTYWYCYLYCRCTRSVSYVPPAYYAHLAAFRGRLMVQYFDESASAASGAPSGPPPVLPVSPALLGTMHYV